MIGPLAKFARASNSFKIVLIYFGKVWRKSNVCIIRFDWLIALYLFTLLTRNTSFLIVKKVVSGKKSSQLQPITVQENIFGEFALAPHTFGPCTSPTDTFFFRHNFTRSLCKNIFLVSSHLRPLPLVRAPPQLKLSPSPTTFRLFLFLSDSPSTAASFAR